MNYNFIIFLVFFFGGIYLTFHPIELEDRGIGIIIAILSLVAIILTIKG
jgi:hypothetical protein